MSEFKTAFKAKQEYDSNHAPSETARWSEIYDTGGRAALLALMGSIDEVNWEEFGANREDVFHGAVKRWLARCAKEIAWQGEGW